MFGTERPAFLQVVLNPVREHRALFEALSDAQVEQITGTDELHCVEQPLGTGKERPEPQRGSG